MVIPDLQLRAQSLGADGWQIGGLISSMFLVQIVASPLWGRLSDRVGRKPVLIVCGLISAGSMFAYAFSDSLWLILASRCLAGLAAANVVVAQAYIGDVTDQNSRTAAMGRIGAAITLGLIAGPAIGGFLALAGGAFLLGTTAGVVALMGVIWILIGVPYRRPIDSAEARAKKTFRFEVLKDFPALRPLFAIAAAGWFALACLEGTFGRLIAVIFGYTPEQVAAGWASRDFGIVFSFESALTVLVQAVALTWITARISPLPLLRLGYLLQGVGLALTPLATGMTSLIGITTIYALGVAVANPTINALCSEIVPSTRQGEMFGLLQSARSTGFLLGPATGGALFDFLPALPYWIAGLVSLGAALLVRRHAVASRQASARNVSVS